MPKTAGPGSPSNLPCWLTASIYVVVTVALFQEFIFSDRMLYGEDNLSLGYMARAFVAERIGQGDLPLWNPRLLGGTPLFEAIGAGDFIYPTTLLFGVTDAHRVGGWKMVLHVLAAGFFMYGWARSLGLGRAAAMVGGLAWLMAPVMVTLSLPGNDGKLMVAAVAPLVFWAAESAVARTSPRTAAALAGAVALTCLITQMQAAYFLFWTVGAYAAFRIWQLRKQATGQGAEPSPKGRARHSFARGGVFLGSSVLGALIAAVQLVPAGQYVGEHSRRTATTVDATPEEAIAYSSSWSLHPEEAVSLAVPEFVGNTFARAPWGQGTYWGRNALKLNHEYIGASVLMIALFALLGRRRKGLRRFFGAVGLTWLLFALGPHTPVWRIFYEVIPGISLFRVPAIASFLVSFAAVTLFALGIDDLLNHAPQPGKRNPRVNLLRTGPGRAMAGFAALLLLGFLLQAGGALTGLWINVLRPDADPRTLAALAAAEPFFATAFALALLFAVLAAALAWARWDGKASGGALVAGLSVLVAVDLGRIDKAFIDTLDFHEWAAPDANVRFLQQQRSLGPFRVADMRGSAQNVELGMFGIDLLAGHHPNDLARYRTFLGLQGSQASGSNMRHTTVLRMANVKYLMWPEGAVGGPPFAGAQRLSSAPGSAGLEAVYVFPGLDRAWVVESWSVEPDDAAAMVRILGQDFDPEREAILAEPLDVPDAEGDPRTMGGTGVGRVEWVVDGTDHREMRVETTGPALLIVSENWFPGWVAHVNGEETPVRRANVTFQAIELPGAGVHEVALRFTAPTVRRAAVASGIAVLVTLSLLVAPAVAPAVRGALGRRKRT